jgi:hypothetical protein
MPAKVSPDIKLPPHASRDGPVGQRKERQPGTNTRSTFKHGRGCGRPRESGAFSIVQRSRHLKRLKF